MRQSDLVGLLVLDSFVHLAFFMAAGTTLRQVLTNVKDKEETKHRLAALYRINFYDFQVTCFDDAGRNLNIRLTEHRKGPKNGL